MAHPNDPPKPSEVDEGLEDEVDDDESGEICVTTPFESATPSTSAYSSFESNKLNETAEDNEEIEVEKEMAEDEEDS